MKNLTIYVYPVPKSSVQNRHRTPVLSATVEDGNFRIKETPHIKPYFRTEGHTPIMFMEDAARPGKFKTGLEEVIPNPLYGLDVTEQKVKYNLSTKWDNLLEKIVEKKDIDRQTYYEILDGQEPGTYHNNISNSMVDIVEGRMNLKNGLKEKSYIGKEIYTLYTHGSNVFSTDTQRGRLAIQCIKNHPSIALDKESINESIHDWFIGRENEAAYDKAKLNEIVNDAIFELETIRRKYSPFDLYRFAIQLKDFRTQMPLVKGQVNPEIVIERLNNFIKTESKWQEQNIDTFKRKVQEFHEFPEMFQIKFMTQMGINAGILTPRDGQFLWVSQINNDKTWSTFKNQETFEQKMLDESKLSLDDTNYFVQFENDLKSKGLQTR